MELFILVVLQTPFFFFTMGLRHDILKLVQVKQICKKRKEIDLHCQSRRTVELFHICLQASPASIQVKSFNRAQGNP